MLYPVELGLRELITVDARRYCRDEGKFAAVRPVQSELTSCRKMAPATRRAATFGRLGVFAEIIGSHIDLTEARSRAVLAQRS